MLILVPVDGSPASLDAVRHVLRLHLQGLELSCVLANVQDEPHLYEVIMGADLEVVAGASHDAAEDALAPARTLLSAAGLTVDTEITHGEVGPQLVDIAERYGCEAIVMGSQGTGWLGTARLGSVCQWVLLHAGVPVTVVRHATREPDAA
ncbi:nucleotide-binding universal stress UspA family protein [Sphaerotilus hippei]|uniref:Nucleotide-binding universal stress UspA family protein n=1 Tax=Sphaerotilus hippei TaxID=744406 RepID=A0A318H5H7_9BURK|nr:universal stress protein [Sphaerotilus hippei]PXW99217.1 nucleotide-binding universal stress UspA family protein [Sphaerotilus hippei]